MKYNNQRGITLVMTLVLIVIGSILLGSLFTVAQSNINTVNREEANTKAFYNADSGVEFVRGSIGEIDFSTLDDNESKYLQFDQNGQLIFDNKKYFFENEKLYENLNLDNPTSLKFSLEAIKDDDIVKFTSIGKYEANKKEFIKSIKFDLKLNSGSFNKVLNIKANDDNIFQGKKPDLDNGLFSIGEDIYPKWEDWLNLEADNDVDLSGIEKNKPNSYEGKIIKSDEISKIGNKKHFLNSIIIIDGNLNIGTNTSFENSIIVVNGNLTTTGFPTHGIVNSVFFIYEPDAIQFRGNFPKDLKADIDFNKLPAKIKEEFNISKTPKIENWTE